jgi:type VI protein secretion system component VasK
LVASELSTIRASLKKRFAGHEDVAWHKFLPEACSYLNQSLDKSIYIG